MKIVVITGSSRGIGYGLADAFLSLGCGVTVSGSSAETTRRAYEALSRKYDDQPLLGQPCDVTDRDQVEALWEAAERRFGGVDIWVNNAGVAHPQSLVWELAPEVAERVIRTNILGTVHGSAIAIEGMLKRGSGSLYNMEGLGSGRRQVSGLGVYGATKSAVHYLNKALFQEARGTPLIVGALRPGMIMTEFIMRQYEGRPEEWARAKRIFNLLADKVENVAPWMAERMLSNRENGVTLKWMTTGRLIRRIVALPFKRRDLLE